MKIGLLFGSFNPIHKGHVDIANFFANQKELDEVWLIISPQNPWKQNHDMPPSNIRLEMTLLAIKKYSKLKASNFEEKLPKPSYTYESLLHLKSIYQKYQFVLLIGGDNLDQFKSWRNYSSILDTFEVWAYPRHHSKSNNIDKRIKLYRAPLLPFSSSEVRTNIAKGILREDMLDTSVLDFIRTHKIYTK